MILKVGVDCGDCAAYGSNQFRDTICSFNLAEALALAFFESIPYVRQLDRNHLPEFILGEFGKAELGAFS
jgi:hypothetical protein